MFKRNTLWRAAQPTLEDVTAAFKVLGMSYNPRRPTSENPTGEAVRKQYRQLAQLHHPDLSSGSDQQMTVINTAYELIQSCGVLQNTFTPALEAYRRANGTTAEGHGAGRARGDEAERFQRKAGSRRRRVPDDFACGDDAAWSMKSTLEWQTMIQSADTITEQEMRNPANHPFSHSKFFSFEDDAAIYRMIRGGATVKQVARTLGKPATFIERRLQNAQFKQRIQYLLREEKRSGKASASTHVHQRQEPASAHSKGSSVSQSSNAEADGAEPVKAAAPAGPNMHQRAVHASPFVLSEWSARTAAGAAAQASYLSQFRGPRSLSGGTRSSPGTPGRKREWEPNYPEWRAPQYYQDMSLEEKGLRDGLLNDPHRAKQEGWVDRAKPAASKMGRSYANYTRLRGKSARNRSL